MRISELARRADLPVATVKYYLREQVLPPGRATAATQAEYDESHLARLRLVRALVGPGGLSLAAVRTVLAAVDSYAGDVGAAVGTAHEALGSGEGATDDDVDAAHALVAELGLVTVPGSTSLRQLAAALEAARAAGLDTSPEHLRVYADAALQVAQADVGSIPAGSADEAAAYVVLGTVLYEPVLLALRRLAQQHTFLARSPDAPAPAAMPGPTAKAQRATRRRS